MSRSRGEFSLFEKKAAFFNQRFFQDDRMNEENSTFWEKGKNDSSSFFFSAYLAISLKIKQIRISCKD